MTKTFITTTTDLRYRGFVVPAGTTLRAEVQPADPARGHEREVAYADYRGRSIGIDSTGYSVVCDNERCTKPSRLGHEC